MRTLFLHTVGICLVTLGLAACSTTNPIVSEWRNPGYNTASFRRVMVGGLGGAKDATWPELLSRSLVRTLQLPRRPQLERTLWRAERVSLQRVYIGGYAL